MLLSIPGSLSNSHLLQVFILTFANLSILIVIIRQNNFISTYVNRKQTKQPLARVSISENQFPEMYIPQNQYNLFPVINIQ
jgi:hypothetical protein